MCEHKVNLALSTLQLSLNYNVGYYYLDVGGNPQGPIDESELYRLWESGEITDDTGVAAEGSDEWTAYDQLFPAETLPANPNSITTMNPQAVQSNFSEYKVVLIVEGGCGTILLGSAGIPVKKMEATINQHAAKGWQVVFQIIETKRFLLFWAREAVIITFGR